MFEHFESLIARLNRQGFAEAARHLEQAKSAVDRSEWEAANSQIRSGLESLFNGIALLKLGTKKKGGDARAALEDRGILRGREARLVQEFMAVAGGAGSHAGVSNSDESLGRFLSGLGIAYLGLGLVPELIKVEDVLIGRLTAPEGTRLPTDQEIHTSCPSCGTRQTLSQATLSRRGKETVYTCLNGCQSIVIVGEPGEVAWSGRGFRLGDHVIRNAQDLLLPIVGAGRELLIPASKSALMTKRPEGS